MFLNNVCFNSSRHGVNFQDGMGGGEIAEGNVSVVAGLGWRWYLR